MSDRLTVLLAWAAGGLLGTTFFGGLWWTVSRGVSSKRPALWFLASLLSRMTVVLAGFGLALRGHWEGLIPCLVGFTMAGVLVTRLARENRFGARKGARRAPFSR